MKTRRNDEPKCGLQNKSIEPLNWMSEKPFFCLPNRMCVCSYKNRRQKLNLFTLWQHIFVWHVSQCHGEHVSYSQYSQNGWKALVFYFIHLSVTRLNQESTKYESKYLRSAVMISGIAVESSHAAHFTRSDSAHVGMLNFYVHILIWNTFFSLLFVFFSRENKILFWQNIFTHRKTFFYA